ncbi:oxidoreductase [Arcticibacterium luteifluviistationis]|uniref:Oxidoreductase n=1 Tax=Arcticibacterium luteifluviistationis TaxID=1784714 RepID=A0A2Z4GCY2_9BACT|nr:oxidoreductase [Arcticibacterium luteifluviistationis]AWV98960.1 oxidoreductase [Arcticibacterium luteifluviistationis]
MSTDQKSALLVGASGLIGKSLLKQLLESTDYEKVIILVRRKIDLEHPLLEQRVIDFDKLGSLTFKTDHVFCTLGTTIKTAGSKEAFKRVDEDYPFQIAENCFKNGATLFAIVSSMGSDKNSRFFYNQVKGQVEEKLENIGFPYLGIFRPSMLLGDRNEKRIGETIGQAFMKGLGFLIPKKYKAIHVDKVALAMLEYAKRPNKGLSIIESDKML